MITDDKGPLIIELNSGDSHLIKKEELDLGEDILIKFDNIKYFHEPYFRKKKWYEVFYRAEIKLTINGEKVSLLCAPYQLPVNVCGLNIMVDLVRGIGQGNYPTSLNKDIRLAVNSSSKPWFKKLAFPIKGYRWRASIYTHTWNGFVHISRAGQEDEAVYYHRGEDYGAYPNKHDFLAVTDSFIEVFPPEGGDGGSNSIILNDGLYRYRFAHANMEYVRKDLSQGDQINKGEVLAKTGNTWNGHLTRGPHLHLGIERIKDNIKINTYPLLIDAYRRNYPEDIIAIAGNYRFCREGDIIELDATSSITELNEKITYKWNFCDGSSKTGIRVKKEYKRAGTYTEELKITNEKGQVSRDFLIVRVSKEGGYELPFAWIFYYPVRNIKISTPVAFSFDYRDMTGVSIDFGDGNIVDYQKNYIHSYQEAGDYIITLKGLSKEGVPGIFKTYVRVE